MNYARRVDVRQIVTLADMVDELTRPQTIRRHITDAGKKHRRRSTKPVRFPSLLDQLGATRALTGNDKRAGGYESRPVANLDALDARHAISHESARLLEHHGKPTLGATKDRVRRCLPLADTHRDVTAAIRRWYATARTLTGWDSEPWRPDSTCPLCGEFRSLRVRWWEEVAVCVHCREAWDPESISLLAQHIRAEAEELVEIEKILPACYCPLPEPAPAEQVIIRNAGTPWEVKLRTWRLCPACGSPRCVRALSAELLEGTPR